MNDDVVSRLIRLESRVDRIEGLLEIRPPGTPDPGVYIGPGWPRCHPTDDDGTRLFEFNPDLSHRYPEQDTSEPRFPVAPGVYPDVGVVIPFAGRPYDKDPTPEGWRVTSGQVRSWPEHLRPDLSRQRR